MKSHHQVPTVTICTDAAYCPLTGAGTWAMYMRADGKLVKTGRVIESDINNSTEAERIGVANALWLANRIVDLSKCRVILYCDNVAAMHPVRPSTKTGAKKQRAKHQLEFYQKNIEPYIQKAMSVDIRHVKSHLDRTAKQQIKMQNRHYMNVWCDNEATRLLTECRKSIDL